MGPVQKNQSTSPCSGHQDLGANFKRWPSDATSIHMFNKAHLHQRLTTVQAVCESRKWRLRQSSKD